jgi:hypothetical protein
VQIPFRGPQSNHNAIAALISAYAWAVGLLLIEILVPAFNHKGHPKETLFHYSEAAFWASLVFSLIALAVSTIELVLRLKSHSTEPGRFAFAVGALLFLFSLAGLLVGALTLGILAFLLMLSSRPIDEAPWLSDH